MLRMIPAILSEWLRKSRLVQSTLYLLAVGVALGLPHVSQAQQVNIISVAGGSSALLGNFTTGNFRQGAIPQIIEDSKFAITGYRPAGVSDDGVLVATLVDVRDSDTGAVLETVSDAMIRWYKPDPQTINVIILLRSDSGNGVRYVANRARITEWRGVFRQRTSSGFVEPTGNAFAIVNAVIEKAGFSHTYAGSHLPTATGYSDVSADTVVRYGNFASLDVDGLQNILTITGPAQTLLLVYNDDGVYGDSGP